MSSGDPQWWYDQIKENAHGDPIGKIEQRMTELERELLQMKVADQTRRLEELQEEIERESNPTLKDAWEQYRAVLMLTRTKDAD
jgi:hypothetical protein